MSKDLDELLDSVFETSRTGEKRQSNAAIEAQKFLDAIENSKGKQTESESLLEQVKRMEELNRSAKSDLEEIEKRLKNDGFDTAVTMEEENVKKDIGDIFLNLTQKVKAEVLGQETYISSLTKAFKRPFIMGKDKNLPMGNIIISGKNGTGRHSALKIVVKELYREKLIKGEDVFTVDLSLYSGSEHSKLFTQDLFSAFESGSSVVLFENYEKCHKSLLNLLTGLVQTGQVKLSSRYVLQKGMFIDVGTALVPNAISHIEAKGQYLVFLSTDSTTKISDSMGSGFIDNIDDICATDKFTTDALIEISKRVFDSLCEKCKTLLQFEIECENAETKEFFVKAFNLNEGVNSVIEFSEKCFKALSELKLNSDLSQAKLLAKTDDDSILFSCGDDTIDVKIKESSQNEQALEEIKNSLSELVGLKNVKEYVYSLEENYKMQQIRKEKGLKSAATSMHMIFTGNPGTGKTTVARMISRYLKNIGVLTGGQLIEVTRADLVGRYVGHTAPLTNQVIDSAIGGVLFIDEAYSLCRGEDDSFGLEAVDTLVKAMEDHRDNLLVILAGYTYEMGEFLNSNSGLKSRFPNIIEFPDYNSEELVKITEIIVKNKGYKLEETCKEKLLAHFENMEVSPASGNGRLVRNLIESAILNQSKRLLNEKSNKYEMLKIEDFKI